MNKTFILDTNVLVHDADALHAFDDNTVVIPLIVIEELDNMKKYHDQKGYTARRISRLIDSYRQSGALNIGVPLENGGKLRVEMGAIDVRLPPGLDPNKKDNQILKIAAYYQEKYTREKNGRKVIFVSKDLNQRIKCAAMGIEVHDFESKKVDINTLYSGWQEILVSKDIISAFYKHKKVPFNHISQEDEEAIYPNKMYLLKDEANFAKTALARLDENGTELIPLQYQGEIVWGITALNMQQRFAFELLLDERISLVSMVGPAGTGKTLLAIASGLQQTMDEQKYKKILISRPVIPMGKDLGYLPGDVDAKLSVWMQPIFDNIHFIMSQTQEEDHSAKDTIDKMKYFTESGLIELSAVTYIRGRSIPKQFFIVDEAQNLTPHEIKTIISRVGQNTKIILTGDPFQIDNPYLDAESNGLSYCVEKFKSQRICGHVTLTKSERSPLASLAADLL